MSDISNIIVEETSIGSTTNSSLPLLIKLASAYLIAGSLLTIGGYLSLFFRMLGGPVSVDFGIGFAIITSVFQVPLALLKIFGAILLFKKKRLGWIISLTLLIFITVIGGVETFRSFFAVSRFDSSDPRFTFLLTRMVSDSLKLVINLGVIAILLKYRQIYGFGRK